MNYSVSQDVTCRRSRELRESCRLCSCMHGKRGVSRCFVDKIRTFYFFMPVILLSRVLFFHFFEWISAIGIVSPQDRKFWKFEFCQKILKIWINYCQNVFWNCFENLNYCQMACRVGQKFLKILNLRITTARTFIFCF